MADRLKSGLIAIWRKDMNYLTMLNIFQNIYYINHYSPIRKAVVIMRSPVQPLLSTKETLKETLKIKLTSIYNNTITWPMQMPCIFLI